MVRKDNLIFISDTVINELRKKNALQYITDRKSMSTKSKNKNTNVYMRINGYNNLVLMHLCNNYFIFINQYVYTEEGRNEDLVKELSKCYWSIGSRSGVSNNNGAYISREIMSIILNGINGTKLPPDLVVHHMGSRSYNTQNKMEVMTSQAHRNHHSQHGQQSHRKGRIILNVEAFYSECDVITSI